MAPKKDALNKAEKAELSAFFAPKSMTKRQTRKSVKKVLLKGRNYGILYVKLGAALGEYSPFFRVKNFRTAFKKRYGMTVSEYAKANSASDMP